MIRVMVVDDSAVVRQVMTDILGRHPDIQVIGAAADPLFALDRMQRLWPDVITLDIEMPRMDGITFLHKLMQERPTPVVVCSSLTQRGADTTLQALAAGAVSVIAKPTVGLKAFLQKSADDLVASVRAAVKANVRVLAQHAQPAVLRPLPRPPAGDAMAETTDRVVAIGTSTGGTQALEIVLRSLPAVAPGIVVVQHMPEKFTASFAARLHCLCQMDVHEAKDGQRVVPGRVLIAPGGKHMELKRSGAQYHVKVFDGPPVNRHCPSVDVLFRSVAQCAGRNATGIIMTGMGNDGARGLKEMRDAGAYTLAQDEASCVVFGMPKEAIKLDAADAVVTLTDIPTMIMASHRCMA